MTTRSATPDPRGVDCPDLDAVNAVLDREASDAASRALRRHVAACAACNEQFGALFEVDSLAPAVARRDETVRRASWVTPLLAAAALVVAAALFFVPRSRGKSIAAPPHLVTSRRVETEIVVDLAGVHTSIRHAGAGGAGSFAYATSRDGRTSFAWTRLPTKTSDADRKDSASPVERPR